MMGVHGRRVHLIETLSDTIISFKKVINKLLNDWLKKLISSFAQPNSTKRVLSIVGPSADSVGYLNCLALTCFGVGN